MFGQPLRCSTAAGSPEGFAALSEALIDCGFRDGESLRDLFDLQELMKETQRFALGLGQSPISIRTHGQGLCQCCIRTGTGNMTNLGQISLEVIELSFFGRSLPSWPYDERYLSPRAEAFFSVLPTCPLRICNASLWLPPVLQPEDIAGASLPPSV